MVIIVDDESFVRRSGIVQGFGEKKNIVYGISINSYVFAKSEITYCKKSFILDSRIVSLPHKLMKTLGKFFFHPY